MTVLKIASERCVGADEICVKGGLSTPELN